MAKSQIKFLNNRSKTERPQEHCTSKKLMVERLTPEGTQLYGSRGCALPEEARTCLQLLHFWGRYVSMQKRGLQSYKAAKFLSGGEERLVNRRISEACRKPNKPVLSFHS